MGYARVLYPFSTRWKEEWSSIWHGQSMSKLSFWTQQNVLIYSNGSIIISECNSVRPVATIQTLLLRTFHQNSEFNKFIVPNTCKNFTKCVIGLLKKWLVAKGSKARYRRAESHRMRPPFKIGFVCHLTLSVATEESIPSKLLAVL